MKSKRSHLLLFGIACIISSLSHYSNSIPYIDIPRNYKGIRCGMNFERVKKFSNTAPIKEKNIVRTHRKVY